MHDLIYLEDLTYLTIDYFAQNSQSDRQVAVKPSETARSKSQVLIVDDDRSVRSSFAGWLGAAGFQVAEASSGSEALRCLEERQFDLVLSDIAMADMDGLSLLRAIRARSDVPVIVIASAAPSNRAAIEAIELGASQYLVKPIDREALEYVARLAVRLHRSSGHRTLAAFHNRQGERVLPSPFTATDAKKEFGRVLDIAMQGGIVLITKHDAAKAVLLSIDEFNALANGTQRMLGSLSHEFDALLAQMQTREARTGMKAAFGASPKELGRAAVAAARKRE